MGRMERINFIVLPSIPLQETGAKNSAALFLLFSAITID
jgi:hypothetical protein